MDENTSSIQYYLGVDWGEARTGLAIADSETRIATGLEEVPSNELEGKIVAFSQKQEIAKIIVGVATHGGFHGKKTFNMFVEKLKSLNFDVELQEEFFSTKMAQQNLAQTGQKGISKMDNVESARIILQSWMDK